MEITRKKTKEIHVGKVKIGNLYPIVVQSMLKTRIENLSAIKNEITELFNCGCEIIRIAIPDMESIKYLKKLINEKVFSAPVIADIQFDYKLAIEALDSGVDCVRINPGNIGSLDRLIKVVEKAKKKDAAIRIGVNSGSINSKILSKNKGNILDSIIESALDTIRIFEKLSFYNFKISVKTASVIDTIDAYQILSDKVNYPLHIGITEAGPTFTGSIKSSVGLGILLARGIGDTIRVSLTDRSSVEVKAAYTILSSLGLRYYGVNLISCPTCSRTEVDLKKLVEEVERYTSDLKKNLNIAVMGCIVNGPKEAKSADIGIAFGRNKAAIFVNGKVRKKIDHKNVFTEFARELKNNF
jgi:(E)-4-hydroxy-3-methylbut-2-enyl-diphosphate synthase